MGQIINKNKNKLALICGVLIAFAYIMHFAMSIKIGAEILLIIASIIGVIPIAYQALGSLRFKVISIDVLVTIAIVGALIIGNYEESAVVAFLFLFGAYLEQRTLMKTRNEIKKLTEMAPESAIRISEDGVEEEVDIDEVDIGDILIVKTGAKLPVDGRVIAGEGSIDESSITGESYPVKKVKDSKVFAGTILENGTLRIEAEKIGEDTTFGKIIELVEEAQDSKSEAERLIDRFAKYYTPAVLILSILTGVITRNIELAITILVLGCPGALVIGVPVSNVAGIGNGAKHGILLKGSEVIHDFSKVDTIIFDKTGTLTEGNPIVTEKKFYTQNEREVASYLVSIEKESHHPLSGAILKEFNEIGVKEVEETDVLKGGGIKALIEGRRIGVGNEFLMENTATPINEEQKDEINRLKMHGNTVVIVSVDERVELILGIRDKVRDGAKEIMSKLRKSGIKNLIMLSGDNQGTVDLVKDEIGLDLAIGNLLPEDKANFVKREMEKGKVIAFVGDGINDSPSISLANVGIAMGSGTDVAIETSDVVLMNSNISSLPHAVGITKATAANMKQNIVIAVGTVIVLLIGLIFSNWVSMSVGMLIHEGSIMMVILNGMRLIGFRNKNSYETN